MRRSSLSSASKVAVPELALDPRDAGDEAVGLDRAQDGAGLGIDLMDLPRAVFADPERALGPGEARVAALRRRRDRGDDLAGARVDLLDPVAGDLPQVLAVEGRAGVGRDGELTDQRAALGIERDDALAAREPHVRAVEGHAVDLLDAGVGTVLAEDLRLLRPARARRHHEVTLDAGERAREYSGE